MKLDEIYNFIVLAPNDWFGLWVNRQQIFSRIGKKHNVFFSNGPLYRWELGNYSKKSLLGGYSQDNNVTVNTPSQIFIRSNKIKYLDRCSNKIFQSLLLEKVKSADPELKNPIVLYVYHPKFLWLVEEIKHDILIYHAYDDFTLANNFESLECKNRMLLEKSNIVFTSSKVVQTKFKDISKRNDIIFLPNGVSYEEFANPSEIAMPELQEIPKPRVGYTGSVNKKTDLKLIDELTKKLPSVSFVFTGRVNNLNPSRLNLWSIICARSNVHYLGLRPKEDIPTIMHAMDVNCLFYDTDDKNFSSSCYPLKLHEYFSVGKPVITTDIDACREYKDFIFVSNDSAKWAEKILYLVGTDSHDKDKLKAIGKKNTWSHRIEKILSCLDEVKLKGMR